MSTIARAAGVLLVTTVVACVGEMPPPPELTVTSPERSRVQGTAGAVVVEGTTQPGPDGARVTRVMVDDVPAQLAADGSFTATIDLPPGAMLLETIAYSETGGIAIDARAVQVGELRPVGTPIERAVTATLSADAFVRLSAAAGPILRDTDFGALLAPMQPMANLGDSIANLKLSVTQLSLGDVRLTLTPVEGGLAFSATFDTLSFGAKAAYAGTLVFDGTTQVAVATDEVTIAGTLVLTPAGLDGFTAAIMAPTVRTTPLRIQASGLTGQVLELFNDNLGSTVQRLVTSSAERALEPLLNDALGALAGPKQFDILGETLDLEASPAAIAFSPDGALVTMNVHAAIVGRRTTADYVFTPNGTPALEVGRGVELALADDLLNELLAQVHDRDLLHIQLPADVGLFDTVDLNPTLPPMISADNADGSLRLVLGDMRATLLKDGAPVISAAINAQVDLEVLRAPDQQQIALKFGEIHVVVNLLGGEEGIDLSGLADSGIRLQLKSLREFLITVPVPSVAGVSLDSLSLHADSGYVVLGGEVR